jgi:serine/threonine protein kinase
MIRDHPSWENLRAYGQGLLALEDATALEEHLSSCESCCEKLDQAPGDGFLNRLRACRERPPKRLTPGSTAPGTSEPAARTDLPAIPPELVDHTRYRVLGPVGQGGMGVVYKAVQQRMERVVALKVIRPSLLARPGLIERFHREAKAAGRLHHPNIVTAYDADQAGGLHFLVMEYVEGISIADLIRERGPLPVAEACEYIRQVALGLQHAHEQGMVHRDIKPHNLMHTSRRVSASVSELSLAALADEGTIKILDFGLARLSRTAEERPTGDSPGGALTGAGMLMGTADYIAPEQAADPRSADIRADIYSLGCTLFHLLTGRPPFPDGGVLEKLAHHSGTPLPSVKALRPELSPALAAVVARMTAKRPADRYATPAEVAAALAPFCPVGKPRASRTRNRRLLLAGSVGTVLAVGLLVGAFSCLGTDSGKKESPIEENPKPLIRIEDNRERAKEAQKKAARKEAEKKAVQLVKKLGGWARHQGLDPKKPVELVSLADKRVTAANLEALTAFEQLTTLDLARTGVTDAGLKHIARLKHLKKLVLLKADVTDDGMQSVAELKNLEALELQFTTIGDDGLRHLAGLTRLQTLLLFNTRITDEGMPDVARLKKLSFLGIEQTRVTDKGLKHLMVLPELKILGLFGTNAIRDEGMKSLARIESLRVVDLCGTGVTDEGLKELARQEKLTSLRGSGLKVTDAGVKALGKLPGLQVLDLSRTGVTDEGLKVVARLRGLTHLDLRGAENVTDAGVKELAELPRLKTIVLANTGVTDKGLAELERCRQLMFVGLAGASKVTDAGVAKFRTARPQVRVSRGPR